MPIVSNTSPLLNLAIIDQLSLLSHQFGEVLIPPTVLKELRLEENLPGAPAIQQAKELGWLRVKEVNNSPLLPLLRRELDEGESEAIALAIQVKAERVLLDERDARKVAKSLGLQVTGVIGILLRAKQEGQLISLQEWIDQLRQKAGFRIDQKLMATLFKEN